jgi:hypothetical protein
MHDETTHRSPWGDDVELAILTKLADCDSQRPWSVAEVQREIGDPDMADIALARLHRVGLIHRCGEFVFATRAGVRANQLGT